MVRRKNGHKDSHGHVCIGGLIDDQSVPLAWCSRWKSAALQCPLAVRRRQHPRSSGFLMKPAQAEGVYLNWYMKIGIVLSSFSWDVRRICKNGLHCTDLSRQTNPK
jgi:hypothetical protein